jgi:hypothetical protein
MRTVVIPPPGILGLGRTRTVGVVARFPTDADCDTIADQLEPLGVSLSWGRGYQAHLRTQTAITVEQEVRALRIVAAVTDCRIVWHKAAPC